MRIDVDRLLRHYPPGDGWPACRRCGGRGWLYEITATLPPGKRYLRQLLDIDAVAIPCTRCTKEES